MKAIKKKSVKLSQFGCHRQLKNSTQQNYVGWCASGPKVAKKVICTGTRPITVGGKEVYRSVLCTVQHSAQPNRYKIATEVGQGNKYVEPYKVVDMACGCGPHVAQQTCSGGLCSVSIPAS